jgi:hypothetical protein
MIRATKLNVLIERSARREASVNVQVGRADESQSEIFESVRIHASDKCLAEIGRVRLRFPCAIDTDASSIRSDGPCASMLLAVDRANVARLRAPSIAQLDGQLAPLPELTALMCRCCAATVVDGASWRRILPLPSPAWLEMTDLWHCRCSHAHLPDDSNANGHDHDHDHDHEGDAHNCTAPAHNARPEHKRIAAQSNLLLVDASTLLIHTSNLIADVVRVNRDDTVAHCFGVELASDERANLALECRRCSTVLGYVLDTDAADLLDNNDARIFTRRITANSQHYAVRRLLAATTECDVAEDLAFHVKQTQQRRFIIHQRGASAILLLLVLNVDWMSWLAVLDTDDEEEIELEGQLRPHVKLAYHVCEPDIESALEIERWRSKLHAQALVYDSDVCLDLVRTLNMYNSQLPRSFRELDKVRVSALKRSSL